MRSFAEIRWLDWKCVFRRIFSETRDAEEWPTKDEEEEKKIAYLRKKNVSTPYVALPIIWYKNVRSVIVLLNFSHEAHMREKEKKVKRKRIQNKYAAMSYAYAERMFTCRQMEWNENGEIKIKFEFSDWESLCKYERTSEWMNGWLVGWVLTRFSDMPNVCK